MEKYSEKTFEQHKYVNEYGEDYWYARDLQKVLHAEKGLKKSHQILDYMGSTELAANLFRATQTDEKIRRENVKGKSNANDTHFEVGAKVRQTIEELGGTMPENLPTPEKGIKQIENQERKRIEE